MNWGGLALTILMDSVVCSGVSRADEPQALAPEILDRCLGILRAGMKSDEFWPAMHGAEALTLAGHARSVDCQAKLIRLLDDSTRDTRIRAAQSLIVLSLPARKQ